jgi:hypothetical protein
MDICEMDDTIRIGQVHDPLARMVAEDRKMPLDFLISGTWRS